MNDKRITVLKEATIKDQGRYVIYWMQQSQRVNYNHALLHGVRQANTLGLPLIVLFVLTDGYPDANLRHYRFMLEGLKETAKELSRQKITFVLKFGNPEVVVANLAKAARLLVMDEGYVREQRRWRQSVLDKVSGVPFLSIVSVDTDLIVPVRVASDKLEYGAYTLRPKIRKIYQSFRDFDRIPGYRQGLGSELVSDADPEAIDQILDMLTIDRSVKASPLYTGGYSEAKRLLSDFIVNKANDYDKSNDPSTNLTSKMSMYLHFGQISALEVMEAMFSAQEQEVIDDGMSFDGYIEQLLVRRELAFNFVWYHDGYDVFDRMTHPWAYETMADHQVDHRLHIYDLKTLELGQTHDSYWNAAMHEMRITGYMHNYMRMYWAKKIIEWSPTYEEAFERITMLNNAYFIDGRDPNSFAGIAWCFGRHDRPWTERPIFGKIRYMNDKGLERKFDIAAYVRRIEDIVMRFGSI